MSSHWIRPIKLDDQTVSVQRSPVVSVRYDPHVAIADNCNKEKTRAIQNNKCLYIYIHTYIYIYIYLFFMCLSIYLSIYLFI